MHGIDDAFKKIDPRRFKDEPESKNECYRHECKHLGNLIKFQWKVK